MLLGILILFTVLFLLSPAIVVILTAVGEKRYITFPPQGFTLKWFLEIPLPFIDAFKTSLILAVTSALANCVLGVPGALAMARSNFRGKRLLDTMLRSPLQVPALVSGVAFMQFYIIIFDLFGLRLRDSFLGLVLAHIAITSPYMLSAVTARLARFDIHLEEAAYGLGASTLRTFFLITLPIIKPAVLAGAFFSFIISFDNVPLSLFLVGSGTRLLPVELFNSVEIDLSPAIFAVSSCIIAFSVLFTFMVEKAVGLRSIIRT